MSEVPLYGESDGHWQSEAWDDVGGGGTRHGGEETVQLSRVDCVTAVLASREPGIKGQSTRSCS